MSEIREINEAYADIGYQLIQEDDALEYIRDSDVTVVYLSSDREKKSKGRIIFAECEKVPDKWKWSVPCDFTITVFEPNVEKLNDDQIRILLLHELMHIGIELDGNEEKYYVVPHDIEDFRLILERYGMEWQKTD